MSLAEHKPANVAAYELEVEIDASPDRVWEALITEIDAWWLPDFHGVDPGSTVTFDTRAGGSIVEHHPEGGSLLWGTVHFFRPHERTVYLVGHLAPDWGGPATTHLKLQVQERDGGSVFMVSDAHNGNVQDDNIKSLYDGWTTLFTDGLKRHVER